MPKPRFLAPGTPPARHILLVSQVFPPACLSEALVTAKLSLDLAAAGLQVTVLTTDSFSTDAHTGTARLLDRSEVRIHRLPVCRLPSPWREARHLLGALRERTCIGAAHFVETGAKFFNEKIAASSPDLIYARGLPTHGYFLGARLAAQHGIPLVLHLSDPWPKRHWPPPYSSRPDFAEMWESLYLNRVLSKAEAVTFPSHRLARYMTERVAALRCKPIAVLPHTLPPDRFSAQGVDLLGQDRDRQRMEIVHTGSLDEPRNPRRFLNALKRLVNRVPGAIRLTFVGARWPGLAPLVHEFLLENDVAIIPTASYADALATTRSADILLLIEAPLSEGIFLPGKFVDYCWAGRPILALSPRIGEVADYLAAAGMEVVAQDSSVEEMEGILESLYASWRSNPGGLPGSACLRDRFQGSTVTSTFLSLAGLAGSES